MKKSTESIHVALALVATAKAAGDTARVAWKAAFGGEPHSGVPHPDAIDYAPAAAAAARFYAATEAADAATAAATEAVGALPWGANGAYFVTRRSSVARMDCLVTVHANGRPLVAAYQKNMGEPFRVAGLPETTPRGGKGAAWAARERADARALRAAMAALPVAVQDALAAAYWGELHPGQDPNGSVYLGAGWYFRPGQEGGRILRAEVGPEGEYGCHPLPVETRGAGRAVREVILPAAACREVERRFRAEAAAEAEAAVKAARALRASFGDRCAL